MKKIMIILLIFVLVFSSVQQIFATEGKAVVYTEFKSGNSNHNGNGTEGSPYNLFEDALSAVADGGIIYVGENGAFINDTKSDNNPFIINKNVKIIAKDTEAAFTVRSGGIVLGGNVTFENIKLSFENSVHNSLFANGYELILNNTTYNTSAKAVHINAGSLYLYNASDKIFQVVGVVGEGSNITIKGSSKVGNIYLGSINGSFDKPVKLNLEDISNKNIGMVYASGALEGYSDPNQILNPDYVPEPPQVNSALFPLNSKAEINLKNTAISNFDGETGGSGSVQVTIDTVYPYFSAMNNIEKVIIKNGTFAPTFLNNGVNIEIKEGAVFNASVLDNLVINDFVGGGSLVLDKSSSIKINGVVSGVTDFMVSGSMLGSGLAEYNHMYIDASEATGDGSFTFNFPYLTQKDIKLEKIDGKWYTGAKTKSDETVVKSFNFVDEELKFTSEEVNSNYIEIPIEVVFEDDALYPYVELVDFVYKVEKDGISSGDILSDEIIEDEEGTGNYEGNISVFNMNLTPATDYVDVIVISKNSSKYGVLDEIEAGTYYIEVNAPTKDGYTFDKIKLMLKGTEIGKVGDIPRLNEVEYGTRLSEIILANGWKWIDESIVTEVGSHEYDIYCEVDDVKYDYSSIEGYKAESHRVERKITVIAIKTEEPTVSYKMGDANGDGVVDIIDVREIMKNIFDNDYSIGLSKKTNEWLKYVDLDNDKKITATDAVLIFKIVQQKAE